MLLFFGLYKNHCPGKGAALGIIVVSLKCLKKIEQCNNNIAMTGSFF